MLLPALAASARELGLPGRRVLVACSGGVDSTVLVHALAALAGPLRLELAVGHVHHGLRGEEADADEASVRALAEKLSLPFTATRVDVEALRAGRPSATRPTLQEAARRARYAALEEQAARLEAAHVATAHTRDDQAETVLLRVFRGAGPDALGGIPERSPDGRIVRPLLGVGRAEVLAYARAAGLAWREDASNASRRYARNRLRADWLPGLETSFNPRLLRAVADLAEAVRRDAEWLGGVVEVELARAVREEGDALWIDPAPWLAWPEGLARRVLRRVLQRAGGGRELSRTHLLRALRFLRTGRPGGRLELPAGLALSRERDGFRLRSPVGRRPLASC
ncbi:MAG TPA: tRNA lysidine(34) synthetase TilS [Myxococcota bacterium]|nr:tRNA lysidine(34) synthetase TilS [Myxococcota bacterium]